MKHELETKIIDSYLNKEITCLEKELAMWFLGNGKTYENIDREEVFNQLIARGRSFYSDMEKKYTKEQLDDMTVSVAEMRKCQ